MKKKYFLAFVLLFIGSLVCGSEAQGALTSAQCQAKGTGSTCRVPFMFGDGCYDSEKVGEACQSGSQVCCTPYTTLCKQAGGRVAIGSGRSSAQCNPGDTVPYSWGGSKCCVGKVTTPAPAPKPTTPAPKPTTPTPKPTTPTTPSAPATPATNDATCKAQGGVCSSTCATGSKQNGTCTSGQCCVPDATTNPGGTGGATTPTAGESIRIEFANPTEYSTVEQFLDGVMGFARNIVVLLALVFLIIGALLYITSGGNDKRIGAAKAAITAALIGLAIIMIAPSFLKELASVLGWSDLPSQASSAPTVTEIASRVLDFLLSIVGVLSIIMLLIGAIMYLASAGDEKRAETGKNIVKYAIIGIIVAFSALIIVKQLAAFF